MQDQIDGLQALSVLHIAETNAVFLVLHKLGETVRRDYPELPDLTDMFLRLRKEMTTRHLEELEKLDPGIAAKLQALIDETAQISTDYE